MSKFFKKFLEIFAHQTLFRYVYSRGTKKARGFEETGSVYFQVRIRNERTGQGTSKDGTAFSPSPFPEKGKNSVSTGKTAEKSRTSSSISAEMTGDSCMARAVVPRTAAAVDHADTELIGHRGWEGTGFLCGGGSQAA